MKTTQASINTTAEETTRIARRTLATMARAALIAVVFAASLLVVAAPANAADVVGPATIGTEEGTTEEDPGETHSHACGPADLGGNSTCADHNCSHVSGECTILWTCKKSDGTEVLGVCPGPQDKHVIDDLTVAAGDDGPEPIVKIKARR